MSSISILNRSWHRRACEQTKGNNTFMIKHNSSGLIALGAIVAASAAAQTWETVDSYQAEPGLDASAGDVTSVAAGGSLFSAGSATLADGRRVGVVRTSTDAGQSWSLINVFSGEGWAWTHNRAITASPSGVLFSAGELWDGLPSTSTTGTKNWFVRRSLDMGITWTTQDVYEQGVTGKPSCADIKVAASGEIYAAGITAGNNGATGWFWLVRKSADGGNNWSTVDQFSSGGVSQANAIGTHPSGSVFVVGSAINRRGDNSANWTVRRTRDGGATWTTVDTLQSEKPFSSAASGIAVDPAGVVYVCGRAQIAVKGLLKDYWVVRRSTDGGTTWSTVDKFSAGNNLPAVANSLAFTPAGIFVCGFSGPLDESSPSTWLVRRGSISPSGAITWSLSDSFQLAPEQTARAAAITTDGAGSVFVSGRASDINGTSQLVTRRLSVQ
jgi:hypothetical protein